ncbi:MAG: hypothetical protein PHY73_03620 [Candidatus Omnitrophica bacterium]|nr:hypothetical protein [Candidatus Omnitrophota bacterium]
MKTNENTCSCGHGSTGQLKLWHRWALVGYVIVVSFFAMKPLIVRQLLSRAVSYSSAGLHDNAIRIYKKAILIESRNANLWGDLGYEYRTIEDIDRATDAYRQSIKIDPTNKEACLSLGLILMGQERYGEAVFYFEQIRRLGPESNKDFKMNTVAYHKASLRMLSTCYDALGEVKNKEGILRDLERYYP